MMDNKTIGIILMNVSSFIVGVGVTICIYGINQLLNE